MTTNTKTKKQVPGMVKTIVALAEVAARFVAAYLILNNFDNQVAVAAGLYMVVTASIIFVAVFHKAFKK